MIVIESDMTIYFDVDETLVLWEWSEEQRVKTICIKNGDCEERVLPHTAHINKLFQHKVRGHKIIVWSQGGYEWAKHVVNALELQNVVDLVICKPQCFYDDLRSIDFMNDSRRIYINRNIK